MAKVKFNETGIGETYAKLLNDKNYNFSANFTERIADILFSGSAKLLKDIKSTEQPAAVLIQDLKGEDVFAIVCKYIPGDEDAVAGSWSLTVSFDKNDYKEPDTKVVKITDSIATTYYFNYALQKYGMRFHATEYLTVMLVDLSIVLNNFMNDNASKGTDADPYVVGLEKIADMVITPNAKAVEISEEIKEIIKNDDEQ